MTVILIKIINQEGGDFELRKLVWRRLRHRGMRRGGEEVVGAVRDGLGSGQ